ncbi:MAG: hypothetical protein KDA28_13885 [Phycisphaerales bacterium]|nr:hypothetical protein [Phycisphaerales bacterium]
MSTAYDIARPTRECAATGRPLVVGEPYVATLIEMEEDAALARLDYSIEAWEAGSRPEAHVFASWKAILPEANEQRRAFISDDELLDLFEQLEGTDEERKLRFRYLLTLILIRKRRLAQTGKETGAFFVRIRGSDAGQIFRVVDPEMDEEAIAQATEEIASILPDEDAS